MTDDLTPAAVANTACGAVAVIGAPNAGKSTLVNALVGQKVAIVSAKAQTTRARLMGIALAENRRDKASRSSWPTLPAFSSRAAGSTAPWSPPRGRAPARPTRSCWSSTRARRRLDDLEPIIESLRSRPERKLLVLNKVDQCVKEKLLVLAQALRRNERCSTRSSSSRR